MKSFIVFACLLISLNLQSQSRYFGIDLAFPSISNYTGDLENIYWGWNNNAGCGLYYDIQINRRFWIQTEIRGIKKGARILEEDNFFPRDGRQRIKYFHIPVLVNTYITPNIFLQLGPYLNFLFYGSYGTLLGYEIRTSGLIEFFTMDIVTPNRANLMDILSKREYGITTGIGYGTGDMAFVLRYHYGLSNCMIFTDPVVRNQSFEFVFSCSFRKMFER